VHNLLQCMPHRQGQHAHADIFDAMLHSG
jgi:hypothetical protein